MILKDSGTFIQTTHVRVAREPPPLEEVTPTVLVEPEGAERDGDPPLPPPASSPPIRRLRSKGPVVSRLDGFFPGNEVLYDTPPPDDPDGEEEYYLRSMRLGEIQCVEGVAERMCRDQKFGESSCARLLSLFAGTCGNLKVPRAPDGKGMVLGAFVHGESFGVTRCGRDLPWVTRYFNQYMKAKVERCWPEMKYNWA